MIPKIIHYCWFGRNPLPESALKCITSWRKFLPDFEIKEWNLDYGRLFVDTDVKYASKVAVLGQTVVNELYH